MNFWLKQQQEESGGKWLISFQPTNQPPPPSPTQVSHILYKLQSYTWVQPQLNMPTVGLTSKMCIGIRHYCSKRVHVYVLVGVGWWTSVTIIHNSIPLLALLAVGWNQTSLETSKFWGKLTMLESTINLNSFRAGFSLERVHFHKGLLKCNSPNLYLS